MGCWDELCLLCGVSSSGPTAILSTYRVENTTNQIVKELNLEHITHPRLFEIVKEALFSSFPDSDKRWQRPEWLPDGMGSDMAIIPDPLHLETWRNIAIGYFRPSFSCDATAPSREIENGFLVPDGRHVHVRQVGDVYAGDYNRVLCTVDKPSTGQPIEVEMDKGSACSVRVFGDNFFNPNIAMCERCYHYLKYWLDTSSLPPARNGCNLSFPGELYEIVNSRIELRSVFKFHLSALQTY